MRVRHQWKVVLVRVMLKVRLTAVSGAEGEKTRLGPSGLYKRDSWRQEWGQGIVSTVLTCRISKSAVPKSVNWNSMIHINWKRIVYIFIMHRLHSFHTETYVRLEHRYIKNQADQNRNQPRVNSRIFNARISYRWSITRFSYFLSMTQCRCTGMCHQEWYPR